MAPQGTSDDGECRGLLFYPERVELRDQFLDRLVPADLLKLPRASRPRAFERVSQTVGVVGHLQTRLPARAQFPLVDRMMRIAFELLGQAHLDEAQLAVPHHLGLTFHHPYH